MKPRTTVWILAGALALPALRAQLALAQEEIEPEREEIESREAEGAAEHPMLSERFLDMLEVQLKLKEGQKKSVQAALGESREPMKKKFDELRDLQKKLQEQRKKLHAMTQNLREKIRLALDNEQKERFDELMAEMRKPQRPSGKTPFGPKGVDREDKPQFPPERWEDNPDRGRRPREEPPQQQRP